MSNIDAVQTYRIRAIKDSPFRAYYGSMCKFLSERTKVLTKIGVEAKTTVFGEFWVCDSCYKVILR